MSTDGIMPAGNRVLPPPNVDALSEFVFSQVDPGLPRSADNYTVVVIGENYGQGSSRSMRRSLPGIWACG
jgi:3-isopropylmalate dehydratase small subunit